MAVAGGLNSDHLGSHGAVARGISVKNSAMSLVPWVHTTDFLRHITCAWCIFRGFGALLTVMRASLSPSTNRVRNREIRDGHSRGRPSLIEAVRSAVLVKVFGERHKTNPSAFLG